MSRPEQTLSEEIREIAKREPDFKSFLDKARALYGEGSRTLDGEEKEEFRRFLEKARELYGKGIK